MLKKIIYFIITPAMATILGSLIAVCFDFFVRKFELVPKYKFWAYRTEFLGIFRNMLIFFILAFLLFLLGEKVFKKQIAKNTVLHYLIALISGFLGFIPTIYYLSSLGNFDIDSLKMILISLVPTTIFVINSKIFKA